MAAPVITMNFNSGSEGSPSWTAVLSGEVLTFTGPDTVAGTMDPITRPTAGVRTADELWNDEPTDTQITQYDGGGQEVADFVTDIFPTNPTNTNVMGIIVATNPETSPGRLRVWDDTSYNTIAEESIAGTTNMPHSFWRAVETASNVTTAAGAGTIPAGYSSQTANTTTYQLQGSTLELIFSSAVSTPGQMQRFVWHLIVPDDASNPAQAARTVELTYHYFYT